MTTTWRPHPGIRPIAIGIVRLGPELLVTAVCDDAGNIKGWRPLGGAIEVGERAAEALRREFIEELGEAATGPKLITVLENLYEHHGARGHEIVFVFETHSLSRMPIGGTISNSKTAASTTEPAGSTSTASATAAISCFQSA